MNLDTKDMVHPAYLETIKLSAIWKYPPACNCYKSGKYPQQFQQIVNCLCEDCAEDIAEKWNYIREQMLRFPENHGVDVSAFPQLSLTDFWLMKEE